MFEIRKNGTVTATFASAQEIIISHANDSIRLGDGTDLMGPLETVGASKAIPVKILSGITGTSYTDDSAFTVASDAVVPIGGLADETVPDSVNEGDIGILRMTLDRLLKIQIAGVATGIAVPITDNSSTISIDDGAGSITIDGTVTANLGSAIPAGTNNIGDVDVLSLPALPAGTNNIGDVDVLSSVLPTGASTAANQTTIIGHIDGVEGLLTTIDVDTGSIDTTLNNVTRVTGGALSAGFVMMTYDGTAARIPRTDADGHFQIDVLTLPTLPAGTNNIGDVDIASIAAGDNNIGNVDIVTMPDVTTVGKAAHDAAVSGNPVRIAGRAMLANGTAVAEDDTADIATDNQGRIINTLHVPRDLTTHGTATFTSTTEATVLAAGGVGVFLDVTKIILTNSSATATRVQIRDASAGTIRLEVALAANGGAVIDFGAVPMCMTTANNPWTAQLSAAVTSVYVYMQAIKRIA